jgi:hypothetical protein
MPSSPQKATPTTPIWRGVVDLAWSVDPVHARKDLTREPGDPVTLPGEMRLRERGGKSKDVIRR